MSAAVAPQSAFDLKAQLSFPVRLGPSVLSSTEASRYVSVRYNHIPHAKEHTAIRVTAKLIGGENETNLSLYDGEQKYEYHGLQSNDANYYVLISSGSVQEKELVLERLNSRLEYNLVRTPLEDDAGKLAKQYPHLPAMLDGSDHSEADGGNAEEPLDPSNPFDYRHYLKSEPPTAVHRDIVQTRDGAATSSPQRTAAGSTPLVRLTKRSDDPPVAQKKRKAADSEKLNPKRVKAGIEPRQVAVSSKAQPEVEIPRVRIDRKASQRRPSVDDSGELILENETPISEKPPKQLSAMALALSGQFGPGPVSLRSAASSPASMMASPVPMRPGGTEEGEQFELGESSPEVVRRIQQPHGGDYFGGDDEDDDDADADVEDLELPSPAQVRRRSMGGLAMSELAEDGDDLDLELAKAFEEDNDVPAPPFTAPESEEESEEE